MSHINEQLVRAIQSRDLSSAKKALKQGANPNHRDSQGWYPLHWACQLGSFSSVKLLLDYKAQIDVKTRDGFFALMLASGPGYLKIVKLLLSKGASVDLRCKPLSNGTVLKLAISWNRSRVARALILSGADVNAKDSAGRTPLYFAIASKNYPMVKLLIKKGARQNPKKKDKEEKKSLLQLVQESKDPRIAKLIRAMK